MARLPRAAAVNIALRMALQRQQRTPLDRVRCRSLLDFCVRRVRG